MEPRTITRLVYFFLSTLTLPMIDDDVAGCLRLYSDLIRIIKNKAAPRSKRDEISNGFGAVKPGCASEKMGCCPSDAYGALLGMPGFTHP